MSKKNLILSLIQDDLVHQKLINCLADMSIDANDYHLNLSLTIHTLMGVEIGIEGVEIGNYMLLASLSKYIPLHSRDEFGNLALEIYNYIDKRHPKNNECND